MYDRKLKYENNLAQKLTFKHKFFLKEAPNGKPIAKNAVIALS